MPLISHRKTLVVITLFALCLTGCASSPSGRETNSATTINVESVLPARDAAEWTMPLDQYMVTTGAQRRESYLHALHSQACLTKQGFEHVVPSPSMEESIDVGRMTFNEVVAASNGYRVPEQADSGNDAWTAYVNRSTSSEELDLLDQCVRDVLADETVPRWERRELTFAIDLASAAITGALQDQHVLDAAARWSVCMRPLGIDDLSPTPQGIPTPSMQARYGWTEVTAGDVAPALTQAEIEDAVFDAQCRATSGYAEALYGAEWDRQVDLLAQNFDALEEIRATIAATDADLRTSIALLAPAS